MALFGGLGGQGASAGKPPREENYWDMWKTTFCPQFNMLTFTFIIWAINTIVYIVTLFCTLGKDRDLNDIVFLGPSLRTLHTFGALDAYEIRYNYQIWRLVTSLLLNTGFCTYVLTSIGIFVVGFMIENNPKVSPIRMAAIYFGTGIIGNLFCVCIQLDRVTVGNEACLMGLVSCLIGGVIVNWHALKGAGYIRICLIFMMVILFVIIMMISASNPTAGV